MQTSGAVGKELYDRDCWRKMVLATAAPHGSENSSQKKCNSYGPKTVFPS